MWIAVYISFLDQVSKEAKIGEMESLMKQSIVFFIFTFVLSFYANSQTLNKQNAQLVGSCEGCEAVFEYSDKHLTATDTLPDFYEKGLKIKITGTIFQNDERTPAKDVILYIYHTNREGIYATKGDETGWGKRHGYIRGWVKTGKDGKYTFYTSKPGIYPDRSAPAHIHPIILEPNGKYYWLGSYHFKGDPFLTKKERSPESPRGGSSGLVSLQKEGKIWIAKRDIILGKNIPNYN
jgi:protocatechuate 3,4-dioxygenase beta subunit